MPANKPYDTKLSNMAPIRQGEMRSRGASAMSAAYPIHVSTFTTLQEQYIIPVDVHQASRLADEKRKRDAGASARFRQRRKEREKDAESRIEKLTQQIRDLERRLRKTEQQRDFYADVVFRNPETRGLTGQAPQSPHEARAASFTTSTQQMGGTAPPLSCAPRWYQTAASVPERASKRQTNVYGDFIRSPGWGPSSSTLPLAQTHAAREHRTTQTGMPPRPNVNTTGVTFKAVPVKSLLATDGK